MSWEKQTDRHNLRTLLRQKAGDITAKDEEIENLQHQIETLREENDRLKQERGRLFGMISNLERDLSNK